MKKKNENTISLLFLFIHTTTKSANENIGDNNTGHPRLPGDGNG
jgi:hypothetical protein